MKVVKDTITHNHHYIRNILYQFNHVHVNVLKSYKTVLVILTIVLPTGPTMTVPPSMYDHVGTVPCTFMYGLVAHLTVCCVKALHSSAMFILYFIILFSVTSLDTHHKFVPFFLLWVWFWCAATDVTFSKWLLVLCTQNNAYHHGLRRRLLLRL